MGSDARGDDDQSAFLIWVPAGAERGLCIAYGGSVQASLLESLAHEVDIKGGSETPSAPLDVALLIGHPAASRPQDREQALADYLATIGEVWARLKPAGTLIVALESSGSARGMRASALAWLRPRTWLEIRTIEQKVRALGATNLMRLHALPSVWRPLLLHTPDSHAVVKRMALAHAGGWKAGWMANLLLRGGRRSALDLCPAGIVWIASR